MDVEIQAQSSKKVGGRGYVDIFSKRLSLCEPMESNPERSQSGNIEKYEPILKSKSHYNTTANTSMVNEEALPISLQFKDFKMLQLLGEGSFGQVFLV
jgi:hypothetical protein